ncbi:hypothetical protein [Algibacter lectus]|uniref:hypothetical protein n=1 Tax=Algibacter lectus TaxID=221126 RepID=UPI00249554F5|nr:hypothetical protein [Algibacter lectus]
MISFTRSYPKDKTLLENNILYEDLFDDVKMTINPKTKEEGYPITSSRSGVFVTIDKYRAYVNCITKVVKNSFSDKKLRSYENLSLSDTKTTVDFINGIIDHDDAKLSGVHVGFTIPTTIPGKEIIKMNVLMHKYKYCNHDLVRNKKEYAKEFVRHNFKIGLYARKDCENKNSLKIELKLNKNAEFKKFQIISINDLTNKKKLEELFNLLLKRFDELIIVDIFEPFEGRDYELLQEFLNYRYWKKLANTSSRQTQSKHKKKFEALIHRYNLDTKKIELKKELNKAFTRFISN